MRVGEESWISYNLYTRSSDAALVEVVAPVLAAVLGERLASSFFFVRYFDDLGPHLRIRLRVEPRSVTAAHCRFASIVRRRVRRCPDAVGFADPEAPAADVLHASQIELEIDRYGGLEGYLHSLRFFAVSSVRAIRFVAENQAARPVRRMALSLSLLLEQALGLARDREELLALLDYFSGWREKMATVISGADAAFDRHPESWCEIFRARSRASAAMSTVPASERRPNGLLCGAAQALADATASLAPGARLELARSHMHMTANRIGLSNAFESYVSHLLVRSATTLAVTDPRLWNEVGDWLAGAGEAPAPTVVPLGEHVERSLELFLAESTSP